MATELQSDGNEYTAGHRWPGPPAGGRQARTGGPQPPPPSRPARRPDPGPSKSPPVPAVEPMPAPGTGPGREPAVLDLTSIAVVDLRLTEALTPELVEVATGSARSTPEGGTATQTWSSLPRLRDDDRFDDTEVASVRPVPGPNDGYVSGEGDLDRDPSYEEPWYEEPGPSLGRPIWPEIRFYFGAAALFFIAFALASGLWVLGPRVVLGWYSVAITSGSMEPAIGVGDVVVFSETPDELIGRGTVIVFPDPSGSLVTHRVIGHIDDGGYVTRGDNNAVNDSTPVAHEAVEGIGRILVPYAGYPAVWTSGGAWYAVAMVAALFGGLSFASRWALLSKFSPWPVER